MNETKSEVIRIAKQYDMTGYAVAKHAGVDRARAYKWLDPNHHLGPSEVQLNEVKKFVGEYEPKYDWRNKTGLEAVIANMYAVEEML